MSSIAYITDSKMLDLHRLNGHTTMNFWRLSNKIAFKNFGIGDLVFFLSKDKDFQKDKEKGIVGYGRLKDVRVNSPNFMWKKYGNLNGYNSYKEFKEALAKVSKNHKVPRIISSFYLEEVSFFQTPVYLSEIGMIISNNVESFVYLDDEEQTINLLNQTKDHEDLWFKANTSEDFIEKHEIIYTLFLIHKKIKDINRTDKEIKKAKKFFKDFMLVNTEFEYIKDSKTEIFSLKDNKLEIVIFHEDKMNDKEFLGQCYLYKKYFEEYNLKLNEIKIYPSNRKQELIKVIN